MTKVIPLGHLLVRNIWPSLIAWWVVYIADYYLTIHTAHLYETGLKEHVVLEGSFELTPALQQDVDRLRRFSPRFVAALLLSSVVLLVLWFLAMRLLDLPELFSFAIGALLLRELALLTRHIRNLVLFLTARTPGSLSGRVQYARWVTLRISATELFTFAGLFFLLYLAVGSWSLLGGTASTLVSGVQHWSGSRKLYLSAQRSIH